MTQKNKGNNSSVQNNEDLLYQEYKHNAQEVFALHEEIEA